MRELYHTGWMTQSVRMVVASFLVEYLRVNWVKGCEFFHYTLVDADAAINAMMWQNAGKCGIDQVSPSQCVQSQVERSKKTYPKRFSHINVPPFLAFSCAAQWNFVLSPETASQDPSGQYTKKWVPELAKLPTGFCHRPWQAPPEVLEKAGVVLGKTYPQRVVTNLKEERAKSIASTICMRREHQDCNDSKGYDMIHLPNGEKTVVFTKKEYRIDRSGNVLPPSGAPTMSSKKRVASAAGSRGQRGRRGRR